MMLLAALCVVGLACGFLLMMRVPPAPQVASPAEALSIIIPARNEEQTLPRLLGSLAHVLEAGSEVLVVDDASADATASVARAHGARVVSSPALPPGWTGKTWACRFGAGEARGDVLLFLDADTWFAAPATGLALAERAAREPSVAVSVLPFHQTERAYEELSLFFNLMMAFGAGGFGALGGARLFGQSLCLRRELYERSGTHAAVRGEILENFALAARIRAAGGRCVCFGGKGVLHMRMFPHGLQQLVEGWTKAFASGASASEPRVLAVSIVWLSALATVALWLALGHGSWRWAALALYAAGVLQIFWMSRQIGSFRVLSCALYPVPLIIFFALFGRSLVRRVSGQQVTWRGRRV